MGIFAVITFTLLASSFSRVIPSSADHSEMLRQLDQLCRWTGLRRLSDIQDVRYWNGRPGRAKVFLAMDGRRSEYEIKYYGEPGRLQICGFIPETSALTAEGYDWIHCNAVGYDTLRDRRKRGFAIAAVNKLDRHLNWNWFEGPFMQECGRYILVTFQTVPNKELKKPGVYYVDPLVTFQVSPKGTVVAAWFGA